jgi:tetratricopeptide (TPR) repeat protein
MKHKMVLILMLCGLLALCSGAKRAWSAGTPATGAASKPATQPADPKKIAKQIDELNAKVGKLFERKEYAKCKAILEQMIQLAPTYDVAWYNLACLQSRTNQPRQAVESLNKAVDLGYTELQFMEHDPDLEAIRGTQGFKDLLARRDDIQRRRGVKIEAELKAEYGKGYICAIDHEHKLVFATNIDQRTLDEVKAQLTAEAKALWNDLFEHKPEQYLTVIIPSAQDVKNLPAQVGGYFQPESNSLVARQIGVTLRHEFTHAMHWGDQQARGQNHSIWVMEGLAGLDENATFGGGHIHPEPSTRLNVLQQVLRGKRELSWKNLFEASQPLFMGKAMVTYPESRYVMMYFYQKGKLREWYLAYCKMFEKDPSGIAATEKVFGKKLGEIEADWKEWVMSLAPLPEHPNKAYLGVSLKSAIDGVEIRDVVHGSGADKAGLKPKDVILKVGGQQTVDIDKLIEFVAKQSVGTVLSVEYRRDGKYDKTQVTLGALPTDSQPPRPRRK